MLEDELYVKDNEIATLTSKNKDLVKRLAAKTEQCNALDKDYACLLVFLSIRRNMMPWSNPPSINIQKSYN